MLAPIATLAFLATLWMVSIVLAIMLGQSGSKIIAALRGRSELATPSGNQAIAVRISLRARPQRTLRARPQFRGPLRAAA